MYLHIHIFIFQYICKSIYMYIYIYFVIYFVMVGDSGITCNNVHDFFTMWVCPLMVKHPNVLVSLVMMSMNLAGW